MPALRGSLAILLKSAGTTGASERYKLLRLTTAETCRGNDRYRGARCAILDFANIDDVGGNLMAMARQVRAGTAWVYNNAAKFGGNSSRLYVCGHSSGGHLAGIVATTDWPKDFGLPQDVVKGALLASGMYDLKPVRLSKRSKYVKFTDEIEHELSSQRHLDRL